MRNSQSCPVAIAVLVTLCAAGQLSAQAKCTAAHSLDIEWVQGVLTDQVFDDGRQALAVSHLVGEDVQPLGTVPEDSMICAALYTRLNDAERSELESANPEIAVSYHRVGDRYLALVAGIPSADPLVLNQKGPTFLISFDAQFSQVGSAAW